MHSDLVHSRSMDEFLLFTTPGESSFTSTYLNLFDMIPTILAADMWIVTSHQYVREFSELRGGVNVNLDHQLNVESQSF